MMTSVLKDSEDEKKCSAEEISEWEQRVLREGLDASAGNLGRKATKEVWSSSVLGDKERFPIPFRHSRKNSMDPCSLVFEGHVHVGLLNREEKEES